MAVGWEVKALGDVCNLIGGGTPSKKNEEFYKGDIPWATVRDMKNEVITQTEFKITEDAVKSSSTNIIKADNVVIATRVGLGKVCLVDQDTAINQDLRGIMPTNLDVLTVRYLFWWLKSIAHLIVKEGTGATVQGVKLPFVKSLQIPLPPLPEQNRIVAILDEAFADIAQAVSNAEKNLTNARELFESYLSNVFTQKGEGWVEKRLGDIARISYGYTAKAAQAEIGPRFLRITDITSDGVNWNTVPYCQINEKDHEKHSINTGDIVFARTGATTGKSYLVNNPPDAVCASYLIRLSLNDEKILPGFLILFFQTKAYWEIIGQGISGSAQGGFNASKLSNLFAPAPSTSKQKEIIGQARSLQDETQHLETIYQQKLTALTELKQSILQKAFAGELTADVIQQQANE